MPRRRLSERLARAITRPPYSDTLGHKGWFEPFSRAQPHVIRRLSLTVPGWPQGARPLRIVFLSDLHAGSHAGDIARLRAIAAEAASFKPDLVLHGGDFVNMQPLGGGRLSPDAIAAAIAPLDAPLGRYAVLGNHDYTYDAGAVAAALEGHGIRVLDDTRHTVRHDGHDIDLIGLPDAHHISAQGRALLAALPPERPAIVLAQIRSGSRMSRRGRISRCPAIRTAGRSAFPSSVRCAMQAAPRCAGVTGLSWSRGGTST